MNSDFVTTLFQRVISVYSSAVNVRTFILPDSSLQRILTLLPCVSRIHLMAGRVPAGSHRAAVVKEMEAVFVQNLRYAADVLSKAGENQNQQNGVKMCFQQLETAEFYYI